MIRLPHNTVLQIAQTIPPITKKTFPLTINNPITKKIKSSNDDTKR